MKQRSVPPLKLTRSPLIFVLAQVKISPVMAVEEKIPGLQDALRKRGFPRLMIRETETAIQSSDGQAKQMDTRRQWEFMDKESRNSVIVDSDGLTFQTTKYDVFETLMAATRDALDLFAEYIEPDLTQRIGLRYIDLVVPTEGKEIRTYFNDQLRGFSIDDDAGREAFFTESVCQTGPNSRFIHRYVEASRGFGFPPDLLPVTLKFPRDPRMESTFGLLDLDHFITLDEDFSVENAIAHFFALHEHQTKAFKASVTEDALEEWKQP